MHPLFVFSIRKLLMKAAVKYKMLQLNTMKTTVVSPLQTPNAWGEQRPFVLAIWSKGIPKRRPQAYQCDKGALDVVLFSTLNGWWW